ncbi:hypothetical protein ACWC10_06415 [Streptomyces sp. NPDC001595]|uniref:hypothetical protein n=1 Tax=Streptomyces sp. NPDC001532 TaxID=3154520 RepID=UPI00331F081B
MLRVRRPDRNLDRRRRGVRDHRGPEARVEQQGDRQYRVEGSAYGIRTLEFGDGARTEVLFPLAPEEAVRCRAAHITRPPAGTERPGPPADAFTPVNYGLDERPE